MTKPSARQAEQLVGTVAERLVGAGSKSEMNAVVLVPDEPGQEAVVLRRRAAKALDAEPELLAYVGRRVRVSGTRAWAAFVVDLVEPIDP
jgi:hypothetical protein